LDVLNIDHSAVSRALARKDAAALNEELQSFGESSSAKPGPGIINLPVPAKPAAAKKVDPDIDDLVWQIAGITLSTENFNVLTSNLVPRRLLSDKDNFAAAYKALVLRPAQGDTRILERNDGRFNLHTHQ